jgi:hypothetical protein
MVFFFFLARKWNWIMTYWEQKESVFLKKPYNIYKNDLKRKINIISWLFIVFAGFGKNK